MDSVFPNTVWMIRLVMSSPRTSSKHVQKSWGCSNRPPEAKRPPKALARMRAGLPALSLGPQALRFLTHLGPRLDVKPALMTISGVDMFTKDPLVQADVLYSFMAAAFFEVPSISSLKDPEGLCCLSFECISAVSRGTPSVAMCSGLIASRSANCGGCGASGAF